ncbi:MAG TPA: ankyrin repeat domain-containing protein [Vicinamibacterales bacterium]|nr:ankyrin repeat domain-containing protein [Vicinamibacterales bacterium]
MRKSNGRISIAPIQSQTVYFKFTNVLAFAVAVALLSSARPLAAGDTRVADAAQRGDRQAVRALVKQRADVNAPQGDGMTALHWAATNGDVEMAQALVTAGANVKVVTRLGGITPLILAAQNGDARLIDLLLVAGADANAATSLGVTPLMFAAWSGRPEAIKALALKGADANAKENTYGQTPLMFAAASNQVRAIEALLEIGANPSIATKVRPAGGRGGRPGGAGAAGGRGGGRGGGPGRGRGQGARGDGQPAPAAAAANGARAAQTPGAPPSTDAAAPAGAATAVRPAAGGAGTPEPPNNGIEEPREAQEAMGGLTPLLYAARQGHLEAVRVLLEHGSNVNELSADRTTPLMMAVINGRFDLAMFLLERGADPKIATVAGGTPLYRVVDLQWAPKSFYPQPDIRQVRVPYLDLMKALLAKGADPNARLARQLWYTTYGFDLDALDPAGATPFWRAAQAGDVEAMRLLVAHGADPSISTTDGVTPLLALAGDGFHGNDAIVVPAGRMPATRYLVEELKADVNATDERGGAATSILHQNTRAYTAVHSAAARGDNEMILYLVSKGARVDLVGKNGLTAADMANGPRERIQPFPETIAILVKLGSKFSNRCISC